MTLTRRVKSAATAANDIAPVAASSAVIATIPLAFFIASSRKVKNRIPFNNLVKSIRSRNWLVIPYYEIKAGLY
jgi:hypothetical protein